MCVRACMYKTVPNSTKEHLQQIKAVKNTQRTEPHCCGWTTTLKTFLRETGYLRESSNTQTNSSEGDDATANQHAPRPPSHSHHHGMQAGSPVITLHNLAVPATSTKWLAHSITDLSSSLPGGALTTCDVAVVDYSVNDATSVVYDNDNSKLAEAIVAVHDKLWPTPMLLVQTYPYAHRMESAKDKATWNASFDYSQAYKQATLARNFSFLNVSSILHNADVNKYIKEWPHPTWEQRKSSMRWFFLGDIL